MNITCKLSDDNTLIPDDKTLKKLSKLHKGIELTGKLDIEQPRSLPQHSRYWAELESFTQSIPEHALRIFWSVLFDDLAINSIIDKMLVHDIIKKIADIESIQFVKMDQDNANRFFNIADDIMFRWQKQFWEYI